MVLLLVCLLMACSSYKKGYTPERRYAPAQLQQDATALWQTLKQCHPSLYWYTPPDSLDPAFNNMIASITDSLTELQFRMRLSQAVAMIRCGHTSVRSSKAAARYHSKRMKPFFPLQVKTWNGDSMVVLANAYRNDSILIRGTSIQTINGRTVKEIIDTMCRFISADGIHNNFKYQLISNNFPAFYKSIIGLDSGYQLAVTTIDGKQQVVSIKNFDPFYEDSLRKATKDQPGITPSPTHTRPRIRGLEGDRKLIIDTSHSLAIMELNTFSQLSICELAVC